MPPTDATMPPGDAMPPGPSMPPGGPAMPPGAPGADVMITIPKGAFDAMHQIVMQLASGLDQLAQGISQQEAGAPPGGEGMPPDMGGMGGMEGEMPPGEPLPEDEEFLRSMMEEGNAKTR